jgi:hypothetical protein
MGERAVWKFPLDIVDRQTVPMPHGAQALTVQSQYDVPTLWALVDPAAPKVDRLVAIFGTGHVRGHEEFDAADYVGTVQRFDGALVLHVFISRDV